MGNLGKFDGYLICTDCDGTLTDSKEKYRTKTGTLSDTFSLRAVFLPLQAEDIRIISMNLPINSFRTPISYQITERFFMI